MDFSFKKRVRALRVKMGLTQEEAAQKIGIKYKTYQTHESGQWPNRSTQQKYLDFYKCDKTWFLTGEGEAYPGMDHFSEETPLYNKGIVSDRDGLWGKAKEHDADGQKVVVTRFAPVSPEQPTSRGQAMDMLLNIYSSGDQVLIRAIVSNLEAFNRAVDRDRHQHARITKLEAECNDLKEEVEGLKKRLNHLEDTGPRNKEGLQKSSEM